MSTKVSIFEGLDVLKNESLFSKKIGSLGDRRVTKTLLAIKSSIQDGTHVEELITIEKSDLTFKNWLKSCFSFLFPESALANKDYTLENVASYTKGKVDQAIKKINEHTKNQGLNNFCDKIAYLDEKNLLSTDDKKILNNIYHIANRAHFYNHDNAKLFETVSKTINKDYPILVYEGESLTPKKLTNFKWNPKMNTRFVALETLKSKSPRTPLSKLELSLGFGEIINDKRKQPNELIKEKELIQEKQACHIRFVPSAPKKDL